MGVSYLLPCLVTAGEVASFVNTPAYPGYQLCGFLTCPSNSSSPCLTFQDFLPARADVENDLRLKVNRKNNPLKFFSLCVS